MRIKKLQTFDHPEKSVNSTLPVKGLALRGRRKIKVMGVVEVVH